MTAPLLDGVRVLDLTNVLAGPFAGYQLALFGAAVTKVEVPGSGDLARQLGADPGLSEQGLGVRRTPGELSTRCAGPPRVRACGAGDGQPGTGLLRVVRVRCDRPRQ